MFHSYFNEYAFVTNIMTVFTCEDNFDAMMTCVVHELIRYKSILVEVGMKHKGL